MSVAETSPDGTVTSPGKKPGGQNDGAPGSDSSGPGAAGAPKQAATTSTPRRPRWMLALIGAIVPVLLLGLWWLVTDGLGLFTQVQLPSPGQVLDAGLGLFDSGLLLSHMGISLQRVLLGFAAGAVAGLALGSLLGLSGFADRLLNPTVGAFRAVPSLAWVPLILLWVGLGEDGKVLLIAIGAFFPVFTSVHSALRHVDPHLIEAGRAFGYHGVRLLTTVQLPAVVPPVFSGLRLGLAQAWLFLVAAELLGAAEGLGFLLTESQNNGRTDRLLLAIVMLAILGKATDALLGLVERKALKTWA